MAMITCKFCGKDISDKATVCPHCGEKLIEELIEPTEKEPIHCEECGIELSEDATVCPNCGCPIERNDNESAQKDAVDESTQKVEVTAVNLKVKKSTKKTIIVSIVALLVIIIGVVVGISLKQANDKKKAEAAAQAAHDEYSINLNTIAIQMLTGASKAESAGNLIKKVWYNAIYEEYDTETDKYTRPKGYWVSDFNEALGNLFSDASFKLSISTIEDNQDVVDELMKSLRNPPDEFAEAYQSLKTMYDAYVSFTNLVTNPTGSLQTFSSNFNDADSKCLNAYNALKLYLSD